jgi:formylmethanofuran dehydrogenase subunit D
MSEGKRKRQGGQGGTRKRYKSVGSISQLFSIDLNHLAEQDGSKISSTAIHGPGVVVTCVKGKEAQAGREIRDVFESVR